VAKKFSLEAIFSLKDRFSAPIMKIHGRLSKLGQSKALAGLNKAVDSGVGAVGRLSSAFGIAGVASVAAFGLELQNVMAIGAEFEKTLIRTGSAFEKPVRVGTAEFKKLEAAARLIGTTTEFSAQQGAEGLNSLATAGYSLEQSIAALPGIVNFASAAALELGQASDITSDALGAFSLRSNDATKNAANMGRVMDSLTRAAADSTTNVAELFEGIRMGGAFAATSGASLEQFVALQGVLANKGIKGAEAGTAIRNSFLHLTKTTGEARDKMASLGVKIAKTKDGSIDMIGTIANFEKGTKKLTRAQKANAIATVFGAYTVGPFLSLMDAGAGTIAKFQKNLERAKGVTEEMAEAMRQSRAAQIAKFWNVIEDVRLTVFDAIAPTVLEIANAISGWVTANKDLIGTKAKEWATDLKDALPEIWTWTVRVGKAFAAFAVAAAAVKVLTVAVAGYEAITKIAAAVSWLWNHAVTANAIAGGRALIATTALKIAQLASGAATAIAAAAQFAYTGKLNMSTLAAVRLKVAEIASKIALYASRAATIVATAAQTAYRLAVALTTGGLGAFRVAALASGTAIGAQAAAFAPLLITLAAAAAAVGALVLAWQQYNALDKDLAGSGGVSGTVGKMIEMGTWDPFKAHDAAMDEKARDKRLETDNRDRDRAATDRLQIVSPQVRAAEATAEATAAAAKVEGRIVVESKPGTKATVKAQPKTVPLGTPQTGAGQGRGSSDLARRRIRRRAARE
jgi:TP901 family phage tail tape measure protein